MSIGDAFLRSIFNDMERRYRVEREAYRRELQEKYKLPVIFVHELLQCPLKQDFAQKFPEIEMASLYNSRFVVGWLIEEAVKKLTGAKELKCHRVVETQSGRYVVAGTADAFLEKENIVIEVKYLTGLYGSPHTHHILQLQLYLYLSGKERGELWMFSPEGAFAQPVEPASEQQVAELVESHIARNPAPKWEWECIHPKTLIITKDGIYTMEELEDKEIEVLSMDEKACFRKARVYKSNPHDEVYLLQPAYLRETIISKNHPIYVRFCTWGDARHAKAYEQKGIQYIKTSKSRVRLVGPAVWMTVGEVKRFLEENPTYRAFVFFPLNYTVNDVQLSDEELFILGLYVAEGCLDLEAYSTGFYFGVHEKELAKRLCQSISKRFNLEAKPFIRLDPRPGYPPELVVRVSSKEVVQFIKEYVNGDRAYNKQFVSKILFLDPKKQLKLINAMVLGDGHKYEDGMIDYATSSQKLAFQVVYMLLRNKIIPSLRSTSAAVWGKHKVYHVRWYENKKTSYHGFFDSEGVWLMIRKLEKTTYKGELYNMEVQGTENYVTEVGLVHNCNLCLYEEWCGSSLRKVRRK